MTVLNPQYPITTDAIHTICTPYGRVLRIVIFIKRATQVLVEFDTVNGAARAKTALDGMFGGLCCCKKLRYRNCKIGVNIPVPSKQIVLVVLHISLCLCYSRERLD